MKNFLMNFSNSIYMGATDPFASMGGLFDTWTKKLLGIAGALFVLRLVWISIKYVMSSGPEGKQRFNESLTKLAVAAVFAFGASAIVGAFIDWVQQSF